MVKGLIRPEQLNSTEYKRPLEYIELAALVGIHTRLTMQVQKDPMLVATVPIDAVVAYLNELHDVEKLPKKFDRRKVRHLRDLAVTAELIYRHEIKYVKDLRKKGISQKWGLAPNHPLVRDFEVFIKPQIVATHREFLSKPKWSL